nr:MAG TPA: hypothetical protein [Caudoviricetes sp.]
MPRVSGPSASAASTSPMDSSTALHHPSGSPSARCARNLRRRSTTL